MEHSVPFCYLFHVFVHYHLSVYPPLRCKSLLLYCITLPYSLVVVYILLLLLALTSSFPCHCDTEPKPKNTDADTDNSEFSILRRKIYPLTSPTMGTCSIYHCANYQQWYAHPKIVPSSQYWEWGYVPWWRFKIYFHGGCRTGCRLIG